MEQAPKRAAAVKRKGKKQTGPMVYVLIVALFLALLVFSTLWRRGITQAASPTRPPSTGWTSAT